MKKSNILIALGLLLCAAAFGIFAYNSVALKRAETVRNDVLTELTPIIEKAASNAPKPLSDEDLAAAGRYTEIPDYQLDPLMELPACEINGEYYVGILSVSSLELPIMKKPDLAEISSQPCVFDGTPYCEYFSLSAADVKELKTLQIGNQAVFKDIDGNCFLYTVSELLQLSSEDVACNNSEWPLTIYISSGRKGIIAIGCEKETPN